MPTAASTDEFRDADRLLFPWYRMLVSERLATLLDMKVRRWAKIWRAPGLPNRVSVSFSQRMRRSLGRCAPQTGVVRLNAQVLRGKPDLLDEVLCHELAHIANVELHGA